MNLPNTQRRGNRGLRILGAGITIALAGTALVACSTPAETDTGNGDTVEITVGAAGPLSGPQASLSAVFDGAKAAFEAFNDSEDNPGVAIKYIVGDDQFNAALTPGVTRKLVETDGAQLMCGTTGSANNASVKDYLLAKKVPTIPTSGSATLLNDVTYQIISDYRPLTAAVTAYAVDTLKLTKLASLTSADPTGQPAKEGFTGYMSKNGLKPVATEEFDPAATNFTAQVTKLKDAGAEFVITNSAPATEARLINAAEQIGFKPKWGSTFVSANTALVGLVTANLDDRIYFATPFPLDDAKETEQFRVDMKKYYPQANITDPLVMEGYVMAIGCIEAIKAAAEEGEPTSESILKAMKGLEIDNDYIKGLRWTDADHSGAKWGQILKLKGTKFSSASDFAEFPQY